MRRGLLAICVLVSGLIATWACAETVHVYGKQSRAQAVASYLRSHGADVSVHSTREITGSLNGRPWPGVNVSASSVADGSQGIFVPVSNDAVRNGLCDDQKRLLQTYIPTRQYRPAAVIPSAPVTSGMRVIQPGDKCDERAFSGMVPNAVLAVAGGGSDAIETHYRSGKSQAYKAKRGRVLSDGVFYPMVWTRDGSCVRTYSSQPITAAQLKTLTLGAETMMPTSASDVGARDYGQHLTEAVFVVR